MKSKREQQIYRIISLISHSAVLASALAHKISTFDKPIRPTACSKNMHRFCIDSKRVTFQPTRERNKLKELQFHHPQRVKLIIIKQQKVYLLGK